MNDIIASIIMPTYNTPYNFLSDAIQSILNQTYQNYELIVIDDGSTEFNNPEELKKIFSLSDKIVLTKNTHSKGVAGALNTGIDKAHGKYIVRMDSDDIAEPLRLEHQIALLEDNPDISLVAGYAKCFGSAKEWHKSFVDNTEMKTCLIFEPGIVHPTVCLRRSMLDKYNLRYSENVQNEDYDLWSRCATYSDFKFSTLPEKVLNYRVHPGQVTKQRIEKLRKQGIELRKRTLTGYNIVLNPDEQNDFISFSLGLPISCNSASLVRTILKVEEQAVNNPAFEDKNKFKKIFRIIVLKKFLKLILKGQMQYIGGVASFLLQQMRIKGNNFCG